MNFFEAIKTCFKKYATFSGRASRSEFWYFQLFIAIFFFTYPVLLFTIVPNELIITLGGFIYIISYIAILIPTYAVACRRLHDINRSGWWLVPILITSAFVIGSIWLIIWACTKSVNENNNY